MCGNDEKLSGNPDCKATSCESVTHDVNEVEWEKNQSVSSCARKDLDQSLDPDVFTKIRIPYYGVDNPPESQKAKI